MYKSPGECESQRREIPRRTGMATPAMATPAKPTPAKRKGRPGRGGICFFCEQTTWSVQCRASITAKQWRPRLAFFQCHVKEGPDLIVNGVYFSSSREMTCDPCAVIPEEQIDTGHLDLVRAKVRERRTHKGLITMPQLNAQPQTPVHGGGQPTAAVIDDDLQTIAAAALDELAAPERLSSEHVLAMMDDVFQTPPVQPHKPAPPDGGERATSEQSRLLPPRSLFELDSSTAANSSASTTATVSTSTATATADAIVAITAADTTARSAVASALFANAASSLPAPPIVRSSE